MAILEGIQVRVKLSRTGEFLPEYDSPKRPLENGPRKIDKYVEAVSGEMFVIQVDLFPDFDLHSAQGIKIDWTIDDGSILSSHTLFTREKLMRYLGGKRSISKSDTLIKVDSVHKLVNFTFGEVKLDEDLILDPDVLDHHAANQGCIKVSICRASISEVARLRTHRVREIGNRVEEGSKKLVKERFITHTMQPTDGIVVPGGRTTHHNYKAGPLGQRLDFTFRYRSNLALQVLDCIVDDQPNVQPAKAPVTLKNDRVKRGRPEDSEDEQEIAKLELENSIMKKKLKLSSLREENEELKRQVSGERSQRQESSVKVGDLVDNSTERRRSISVEVVDMTGDD